MSFSKINPIALSLFLAFIFIFSLAAVHTAFAQVATSTTINPYDSAQVEARVRQYFSDVPAMAAIAKCESGFRQYGPDGLVLYDPSYSMIGVFQISSIHIPQALGFGMDVMTLEGNMAYARYLYSINGIDPWMSSFDCWGSQVSGQPQVLGTTTIATVPATSVSAPSTIPAVSFSLGVTSAAVQSIQQMLNQTGFAVAASGPGSPGAETTMFGSLTRAAVRRFQCAKMNVCSGDESTTGYGMVNAQTYAALVAAATPASTVSTSTNTQTSADKAAQILQIQTQISSLTAQINNLNAQLTQLQQ